MTVAEIARVAAASVLLIAANMDHMEPVTITRMQVPAIVEVSSHSAEGVLFDCDYDVTDSQELAVRWYLDQDPAPVYEWRPDRQPVIGGFLAGRVDPDFKITDDPLKWGRAFSISNLTVDLSGQYTCEVSTCLGSRRQTKTMLVYSEEHDLQLSAKVLPQEKQVEIFCSVSRVYPKPDLRLERFRSPITRQTQRVQKCTGEYGSEGLMDATTTAALPLAALRDEERFVCRLQLREATYEAKRELIFNASAYRGLLENDTRLPNVDSTAGPGERTAVHQHPEHAALPVNKPLKSSAGHQAALTSSLGLLAALTSSLGLLAATGVSLLQKF